MAGHSKFANIKHKKEAQDSKRAKVFVKIIKEITVAVKKSGPDITTNSGLRLAIDKAKIANMPKDNYEKAIKRASGQDNNNNYDEIRYEGYGPFGVAIMVDCLTDNKNRTSSNVRNYFKKSNGNLGTTNSVGYLFEKKGSIVFKTDLTNDKIMEKILELEILDINLEDDTYKIIYCESEMLNIIKEELQKIDQIELEEIKQDMVPNSEIELSTNDDIIKLEKLINNLEDDDDVQQVYHNAKY
ncbi:YebC/PmpR family DNA-binding transcriptional regulator [Spiroplasma endosymbiont of Anurida maritima]|uniref:YebC/PmpR family DNA-binding transcriptional regulator n=1 Tax=Spiroplasma endosymbiont of Anurida maritima TaxID=2967972 RepID=UPI0036D27BD5